MRRLIYLLLTILLSASATASDSIPSGFSRPLEWRIGAEVAPAYVPGTNRFLEGINPLDKFVRNNLAASLRADFSFSPDSREGILYRGLYQGIGVGMQSFFSQSLLGTPVTAYVYQGAPIASLSERLWLGYEWKFGAAFGWKHYHEENAPDNSVVSTDVTAMMALGFKLHYAISDRWNLSFGVEGQHFSNGNTSWPNAGINSIGASIGIAYLLNPATRTRPTTPALGEETDHGRWLYDIVAYGAWRKREVFVGEPAEPELCPGKFAIAGLQCAPLRWLNRYGAVGPALALHWVVGAGLSPYGVDGTTGDFLLFYRPPFGKQLSIGVSAHAELTMPIFSVNAGLGYDILSPVGNERFYQSLTLKTFVTRNIFLNVGYRLSNFKTPQNLILGVGIRL